MKKIIILISIMTLLLTIAACQVEEKAEKEKVVSTQEEISTKHFKILHIMSYHSPWKWTDDQLNGFKAALNGLDVEYKVFQMDTKRKSSEEWKLEATKQAKELIDTWQPDLVYTNDDNAQKYVVVDYVNSDIPFVFSAVNADPAEYGFTKSSNVAGILEQEHFVETVNLLKEISPNVKKIAVIYDDDPTWPAVVARMKEKAPKQLREFEFISWDKIITFEEYKQRISELQSEADAIALLGIFTFKDENDENVPYQDVLKWTAENSNIPDFSFWEDRVSYGTLCAVTVSGYEQGYAAGKIAKGILVEGKSPSSYPFEPTVKGEPVISLARANKLGIKIKSGILLSAQVIEKFAWED
jgi:ABC-type uncharacterized transport system substrate-binding protein